MTLVFFSIQFFFSLFMVKDAWIRLNNGWIPVILFPFGEMIYFLVVKRYSAEWNVLHHRDLGQKKMTYKEAESLVDSCPSIENLVLLGICHFQNKAFRKATNTLEPVLLQIQNDQESLFYCAAAYLELGKPQKSAELLEKLYKINPTFNQFSGELLRIRALWENEEKDRSITLLRNLQALHPRPSHHFALAHFLFKQGDKETAKQELRLLIQNYKKLPPKLRGEYWLWAELAFKSLMLGRSVA